MVSPLRLGECLHPSMFMVLFYVCGYVSGCLSFSSKSSLNPSLLTLKNPTGHTSNELCALSSLQILDFAHNNLSGSIPRCVGNLSAMEYSLEGSPFQLNVSSGNGYSLEHVLVVMKAQLLEYSRILYLVKVMDFSSNNLSGEIPTEMTNLKYLPSLNLSHNFLTGRIPANMGNMRMLESLDLSVNELSGPIPESMSSLTFLSYLDMSDNQLIGKIPTSTQLQSFNAFSYAGNKLCGLPLMDKCSAVGSEPRSIQTSGGRGEGHGKCHAPTQRFRRNKRHTSID
ncbi:hypothetical protein SLEP1_g44390 [Rubroshorea leprosula]|uniref:Uncharacterized protein n=1 Tax=Rubroshorea leprosula TaxID=152421 RepID=A0AAV5LG59_9ROSI|nr:hypothetical protein SLEP1_g44390 [Rubroshorea leprosula]